MSLTNDDLQAIREIIKDEVSTIVRSTVQEELNPITGEIEALGNDIKEIYEMLTDIQNETTNKTTFKKANLEEKILRLHAELVDAAKQANITLPSH
jgi:predicted  nucleic acid-binding Zn-ribbon protein